MLNAEEQELALQWDDSARVELHLAREVDLSSSGVEQQR
jgi:hypothetical protein